MPELSLAQIQEILQKRFKKQVLYKASDERFKIRRLSTGIPVLDRALGGGIPIGRTVEFYGPLSSAKSLTVWMLIAEAQKRGMRCALADTEKSFDPKFVVHFGLNVEELLMIGDLEKGEQIVDYMEVLMRSGGVDFIALDSVDALVPQAELDKSATENTMGRKGQLTSRMMRKLTAANQGNCTLVLTNQMRDTLVQYGPRSRPGGGRAIGHYASQRLEFKQGPKITQEVQIGNKIKKVEIGHEVSVKIAKDKTGPNAFKDANFKYYTHERRIDVEDQLLTLGLQDGLVEQVGFRYQGMGSQRLTEKAWIKWLSENEPARTKLSLKVNRNTLKAALNDTK